LVFNFDVTANNLFQEAKGFGDILIQVDIARLENLAARERQVIGE
jgi:hypothetical protein